MRDFLFAGNWFERAFKEKSDGRYQTFKTALNLFVQRRGRVIVETGTTRMASDWGAGMSTVLFAEVIARFGGKLYTVDISEANIETCKEITKGYQNIEYVVSDSIRFLDQFQQKIDLLYLDSWDYPLKPEEGTAAACQRFQLKEYLAAKRNLSNIILLDDNLLPEGGKCRYTKENLFNDGWKLLIDDQQSLWVK